MNIALINVVGKEGSTGKIVSKLAAYYMKQGHECRVFHGRGERLNDGVHIKHGNKLDTIIHYGLAKVTDKEGYYSTLYTRKILKDIKEFKPELIIIVNLHGHWMNIPLFLSEISMMDVDISWFMADEYPFTARCEYTNGCDKFKSGCKGCERYKNIQSQYNVKRDYYEKLLPKTVFSSVEFIVNSAKESSLLKGARFDVKNTGIDVDYYHPVDSSNLKNKLGIDENKTVLIDVAPWSNKRKGVKYFIDSAKILEQDERFLFVNIGYDGDTKELPSNFVAIPYVSDQEKLRQYYSMADRYVCTSIQDALPNACVEAMSCGTPLIAFNTSGMPYLASYPTLELVDSISADKLAEKIRLVQKKTKEISEEVRADAISRYAFSEFAEHILQDCSK